MYLSMYVDVCLFVSPYVSPKIIDLVLATNAPAVACRQHEKHFALQVAAFDK